MTTVRRLPAVRPLAALAFVLLALTACGAEEPEQGASEDSGAASVPAAPSGTDASAAAADWLAGQLEDGLLSYRTEYGPFTDHGMSIDAALALDAAGGHDEQVAEVADAVGGQLDAYTEFPSGKGTHVSAGAVAKAAVVVQVAGGDAADVDGVDLVGQLEDLTGDDGRIADTFPRSNAKDADYANVIGQVFAVRALSAAGSPEAAAAQELLLGQQCSDGGFRATLAEPGSSCSAKDADADTTALAVVGLAAVEEPSEDVTAAAQDGADWLAGRQDADGAVPGGQPATANANTTGLAGWAFGETGRGDAAAATGWLEQVQLTDGPDAGALGFDPAAAEKAAGAAIPPAVRSQFLLATAQALPGLLSYPG